MDDDSKKSKSSWITEGLVIALLTVYSYTIAFSFETGIADHFGIPLEFIEINITGMFVAFIALLSSLVLIIMLLELFNPLWSRLPDPIRRRLRLYLGIIFAIVGSLIIAGGRLEDHKLIFIFFGIMIFFDFVLPALSRNNKSYSEKVQEIHKADLRYDTLLDKLIKSFSLDYRIFNILIVMIFVVLLAFDTGLGRARKQVDFLVLQKDKNQVVLRKYNDLIITASLDRDKKELSNSFSVYRFESGKSISFQAESIGPLSKAKKEKKEVKVNTDE